MTGTTHPRAGATSAAPVPLSINTPRRFYRGGERILLFRGLPVPDDFDGQRPEDWLASTTRLFAEGGDGLSDVAPGIDLPSALGTDPEGWLGPHHLAHHGRETALLTKLLDSGERLPVHSHPDRHFAARHLDCAHGKTEAWIVLAAEPGATVWLGFREGLSSAALAALVDAQDQRLLEALNRIEVQRGDALLVPAGQPHAIGEGILVLELQEPSDLSVMLEHERFGLEEAHAFLGLPRGLALESVTRRALTSESLGQLRTRWIDISGRGSAVAPPAVDYFRAEVVRPVDGPVDTTPAFAVTVVVDGHGTLRTGLDGSVREIDAGDILLVPHSAGRVRVEGEVTVIRCMPPEPPVT